MRGNFLTETVQARRPQRDIFKALKENYHPEILFFEIILQKWRLNKILDNRKLKELIVSKFAMQESLTEVIWIEGIWLSSKNWIYRKERRSLETKIVGKYKSHFLVIFNPFKILMSNINK